MREAVEAGRLVSGDPVPATAQLARHPGLAKSTVHRALMLLDHNGVLEKTGTRWTVAAPREVAQEV